MKIELIPVLQDNYIHLITAEDGTVAAVDPAVGGPVKEILDRRGQTLSYILNTHHHADHIGGNAFLKKYYDCKVMAPKADAHRIPDIDMALQDGDMITIGTSQARVIETPGHTTGHICFWFEDDKALFCGDTLFSMGCGRLFEGTATQMWDSLSKLAALPDETMIYCAHEYTQSNGRFALSIEPENDDIKRRMAEVTKLREQGVPTLPVLLATEKKTNIFLRAGSASRFADIRALKDSF